jgi:hypothetical protein
MGSDPAPLRNAPVRWSAILQQAEPVTQDLGQFQEADGWPVGRGQEPLAGCPWPGHRTDAQAGAETQTEKDLTGYQ